MIGDALESALAAVKVEQRDTAAVALARAYAAAIDGGEVLRGGPALLAVLKELHMTPASRPAATREGGASPHDRTDKLDELEQRRAARVAGEHASATVD